MRETPQQVAERTGLSADFQAVQRLRTGVGLAKASKILTLPKHLQAATLDAQLLLIDRFIASLSDDDGKLARIVWNRWNDDDPERKNFIALNYTARCRKAAGPQSKHDGERAIRGECDQQALDLLLYLRQQLKVADGSARVTVTRSPAAYKDLILAEERDASNILRIPKRISVIFKTMEVVQLIAERRFGRSSPNVNHYVEEHRIRQRQAFDVLDAGALHLREIYSTKELAEYVSSGPHGVGVSLKRQEIIATVDAWLSALERFECYDVALSDDPLPFKYQIVDDRAVVMHEAIGKADSHRLNAISIADADAVRQFAEDFELIWERADPDKRDKNNVIEFVQNLIEEEG